MRLFARDPVVILIVLITLFLSMVPLLNNPFYTYLTGLFMIFGVYALAYNVLYGYAGLLSFGHAMFFSAGAYGYALYSKYAPVPKDPLVGVLAGLGFSISLALVTGALTLRTSKIYFAMLTLAFGMLFWSLLIKWRSITGGSDGIVGMVREGILVNISDSVVRHFFIVIFFTASLITLYTLHKSKLGLLLRALGSNEDFIPYTGHSVFRLRMMSFIISGLFSGLAGALYAPFNNVVIPDIAYWTFSANPLVMTLIGGSSSFSGPLIGALIIVILTTAVARLQDVWQLVMGVILVLLILWRRGGISDVVMRLWSFKRS